MTKITLWTTNVIRIFSLETEVRIRKKKCKIQFEAQEKAPQDPKQKFIIYVYAYLDKAIQSAVEKSQTK